MFHDTYMMGFEGLRKNYQSEEESSSEVSESSGSTDWEHAEEKVTVIPDPRAPKEQPRSKKKSVKMSSVIGALGAAAAGDEKTERKLAKLQKKLKRKGKEEADMAMDPTEILQILPHLGKEEKRSLFKQPQDDLEEEAYRSLPADGYPKPKSLAAPPKPSRHTLSPLAGARAEV